MMITNYSKINKLEFQNLFRTLKIVSSGFIPMVFKKVTNGMLISFSESYLPKKFDDIVQICKNQKPEKQHHPDNLGIFQKFI